METKSNVAIKVQTVRLKAAKSKHLKKSASLGRRLEKAKNSNRAIQTLLKETCDVNPEHSPDYIVGPQ